MIGIFLLSLKLRVFYIMNCIIYSLKQLPIIGKNISDDCYSSKFLKKIGIFFAVLKWLIWDFLIKKLLYFLVFFIIFSFWIQSIKNGNDDKLVIPFMNIFIFLSIIGGFINNDMFSTDKDKYYAIFMLRIDSRKFVISNYLFYLLENFIMYNLFILVFSNYFVPKMDLILMLLLPFVMINIKAFIAFIRIKYFEKTRGIVFSKPILGVQYIICFLCFICAYLLPILDVEISTLCFLIIFFISLLLGGYGFVCICKFDDYKVFYKKLFSYNDGIKIEAKMRGKNTSLNVIKQEDDVFVSDKTGYAFFNEIFINRHKKMFIKKSKTLTMIISAIFVIVVVVINIPALNSVKKEINRMLLFSLPSMIYVMFITNNGTFVTQTMFMNCDHSMLTYKFYRDPNVILGLFKERLKSLIKINIVPAISLSLFLPILLFLTGGTDNFLNYIVLFVSIISMSVFFSTHSLVLYYLIQPYNIESEMKSVTYNIAIFVTSIAFYSLMRLNLPTILFGLIISTFAILYIFVSLFLIYRYAPGTFKIRK